MQDYEAPVDSNLRMQGWVVASVLTAITVVVVLLMAFSTHNTPMSVDGDRATYSHNLESGSGSGSGE